MILDWTQNTHTHTHTYIYMWIYMHTRISVCMCMHVFKILFPYNIQIAKWKYHKCTVWWIFTNYAPWSTSRNRSWHILKSARHIPFQTTTPTPSLAKVSIALTSNCRDVFCCCIKPMFGSMVFFTGKQQSMDENCCTALGKLLGLRHCYNWDDDKN